MAYEKDAGIDSTLLPLEAKVTAISDGNIPPRVRKANVLATPSGRIITYDLPYIWVKFIADACNKYFDEEFTETDYRGKVLAKLQLFGEPRVKEDSRQVAIDENGIAYIAKIHSYRKWVERNRQGLKKIFFLKPKLPITVPVHVEFRFYVKPRRKGFNPSLGDYISAGLDCLKSIGVLSDIGRKEVISTDGSRIYTDFSEPKTDVIIRANKEVFDGR